MATQLTAYANRYKKVGILLDTNVLLLLLFANFQPGMIGGKRLEKYTLQDAALLAAYVRCFSRILTTQHILAETSNLAAQVLGGKAKAAFFTRLFPLFCSDMAEALHPCKMQSSDIDQALFVRLGLTDASVVAAIGTEGLLLTDDLDLHLAAIGKGSPSINFTHMREATGLL